jgi:predicted GIY-YIG superfamily endonuclease
MTEGIYMIHCLPTGDVYIGSSKRIEQRWVDHKSSLQRSVHHCTKLQDYWNTFGSDNFEHKTLELTSDLEARETYWMQEYKDNLLNTAETTHNPMRSQASVDKMLATRGTKQHGAGSSSAKLTEDKYLQIVYALTTTTYSPEDLSDYFGLSPRSIRDILKGSRHVWIREQYPTQFETMQRWRKNLRVFRATDTVAPEITLPIDTSFVEHLHSFRRDYAWKTDAQVKYDKLQKEVAAKEAAIKIASNKEAAKALTKDKKEMEKLNRQLNGLEAKDKKPWIALTGKDGQEIVFYSTEEATAFGLDLKYLQQLKLKKIIRYKGWRLSK